MGYSLKFQDDMLSTAVIGELTLNREIGAGFDIFIL